MRFVTRFIGTRTLYCPVRVSNPLIPSSLAICAYSSNTMIAQKPPSMQFSKSPSQYLCQVKDAIRDGKGELDRLAAIPIAHRTFDSIVEPFAKLEAEFRMKTMVPTFLQYVSTDVELRKVGVEATKLIDDYEIEKGMNEGVYQAISTVLDKEESLSAESKRLLDKVLLGYRRNGLALSADKREQLKEKRKRLAQLETDYSQNMNEENSTVLFTKQDLDGCSNEFLEGLQVQDGFYVLTMKYPEVNGVLRMAKKRETREKMYKAFNSRCPQNVALLREATELRRECARLLGYPSHAEFQLEERLAKKSINVKKFEDKIRQKLIPLAHNELATLAELKREELGLGKEDSLPFDSVDFAYYNRLLTIKEYSVDFEMVKEYFSLESVVPEMLNIYQEVLGLKFERLTNEAAWHEDVQTIQVNDAASGEVMGYFYLDLFPRAGKYSHAACFPIQPGYLIDKTTGDRCKPTSAIVANFSKPGADKPSLLRFDEVVTLFHELGHAMHGMCSVTRYYRFHGTSVETDFVEAPSQMLENWVWDAETMSRLSAHYKSGEKIPQKMIEQISKTRRINAGLLYLRQIFFGIFDLTLHSENPADIGADINELYSRLKTEVTLLKDPAGICPSGSFGHLMGGYDAGYYGYLWSEVFSSDMFFSRFKKEGLQNQRVGLDYRHEILQPGGSRDGMESICKFLGREPNQEAFLKSIGI